MYYLKFKNGIYTSVHLMKNVRTLEGAKRYIRKLAKQDAPYKSIDDTVYTWDAKNEIFISIIICNFVVQLIGNES